MSEPRAVYNAGPLRTETLLPFADPRYVEPTVDEIREVAQRLGKSAAELQQLLGVRNPDKMREFLNGKRTLSYAAWRLMLITAGLALEAP